MRTRPTFAFACFCGSVFQVGMSPGDLIAQTSLDQSLREQTESRLRDVYERGEFRDRTFDDMVYPNRNHGLREGRRTVVHVKMLIIRYLLEHIPRGPR